MPTEHTPSTALLLPATYYAQYVHRPLNNCRVGQAVTGDIHYQARQVVGHCVYQGHARSPGYAHLRGRHPQKNHLTRLRRVLNGHFPLLARGRSAGRTRGNGEWLCVLPLSGQRAKQRHVGDDNARVSGETETQ